MEFKACYTTTANPFLNCPGTQPSIVAADVSD